MREIDGGSRGSRCAVEVSQVRAIPLGAVWACLADPMSFAEWVSGTQAVRGADGSWPAVGAELRHRWGRWPARIRDRTRVTACDPPHALDLDARVRPIANVRAWIRLSEVADGTRVVLGESIERGLATVVPPLTRRVQRWRNRRSLDALLHLAESRR